jgi:hypothetical protein
MSFIGISCYDQSTFCSTYQTHSEYCNNIYSILINNSYIPVLEACQRSCGQCVSVQNLTDVSSFVAMKNDGNNLVVGTEVEIVATPEQNMILSREDKCFDGRDDCSIQKAIGFCDIFNEKYPNACVKTCHSDCAFLS